MVVRLHMTDDSKNTILVLQNHTPSKYTFPCLPSVTRKFPKRPNSLQLNFDTS